MLIPFIALLLGFFLVLSGDWTVQPETASYLAAAILAGMDTAIGGIRARLEDKFDDTIFLSGFIVKCLLAASLVYLGDLLGIEQMIVAPIVAFGIQMFRNLAIIRSLVIDARLQQMSASDPLRRASRVAQPPPQVG